MSSKRMYLLCLLLTVCVVAVKAQAASDVPIKVNPAVLKPVNGKLPTSLNLAVYADPCDASTNLSSYTIWLTGGFPMPTDQHTERCRIIATVAVDPNTPPAEYWVMLRDQNQNPVGHATLSVADAAAGPIPPGLAPQVDVMWEVMGFKNCSDAFGRRVAQAMYCVQVKIGNNSGYPLQIAGMGFSRKLDALAALGSPLVTIANSSYASTRAILVHHQAISTRNVVFDVLEGSGLILAASAPFFNRQNPKKNFLALSTIVNGPLQQAYNLIFPDPIVRQLGNLDDQSFRDNVVIANNAHMQTVVFVEKQALTQSLEELQIRLSKAEAEVSGKKEQTSADKVSLDLLKKMRVESSNTAENSKRPLIPRLRTGAGSPLLVKLALGDLVIVGDEIKYLQRVQVVSSPSPGGVAVSISPTNPSVQVSSTVQFKSTVTGTSTTTVTWSVKCAATGSACGTIDPASGLYTAPATPPSPSSVTVTATSTADTTKSAATTVTIVPPPLLPSNSPLDFGTQSSATTKDLTFTGTSATAGIVIGPATVDGTNKSDFVVASNACTEAVATSTSPCAVKITFTPTAGHGATENATLTLKDNSGNVLGLVALTGTAR